MTLSLLNERMLISLVLRQILWRLAELLRVKEFDNHGIPGSQCSTLVYLPLSSYILSALFLYILHGEVL